MSWTFLSDSKPKARRDHVCWLCGGRIPRGETHVARRGITDDGPSTAHMHLECEALTANWTEMDWESGWDAVDFMAMLKESQVNFPKKLALFDGAGAKCEDAT